MTFKIVRYPLGDRKKEILEALERTYPLNEEPLSPREATLYDTFDWRLAQKKLKLEVSGKNPRWTWALSNLAGDNIRKCESRRLPGFARDIEDGAARKSLEPILEMRRLLPLAKVRGESHGYRILDGELKTVVRMQIAALEVTPPGGAEGVPLPMTLELRSLRGYEREWSEVRTFLEQQLGLVPQSQTEFVEIMSAVGQKPGGYTSKLQLKLKTGTPARQAAITVYHVLLETIQLNEEGVRKNLDSEFLHDLRVAVRRTRAGLTQLKGILPVEELRHFKQEFAWLGSITGPARDLDVYLLKYDDFTSVLPLEVRADLAPLATFLRRHQREEAQTLNRALRSKRYGNLVKEWRAFLSQVAAGELEPGSQAARPIEAVASARILKLFNRVLKKGRQIDDGSPASALHELRIECKKLRYVIEFFRSLYPRKEMKLILKALKLLQDNLGDFNDYEVQQGKLGTFATQMVSERIAETPTLLALGRLVERLNALQQEKRSHFSECFETFQSDENVAQFQRLFSGGDLEPV